MRPGHFELQEKNKNCGTKHISHNLRQTNATTELSMIVMSIPSIPTLSQET